MHMLLSILCKSGITKDTPTNEFSQSMKLHSQYCPRLHGLSSSQTHSHINDSSYSRDTSGTKLSSCLVLMSCLRSDCWKLELSRTMFKASHTDVQDESALTSRALSWYVFKILSRLCSDDVSPILLLFAERYSVACLRFRVLFACILSLYCLDCASYA